MTKKINLFALYFREVYKSQIRVNSLEKKQYHHLSCCFSVHRILPLSGRIYLIGDKIGEMIGKDTLSEKDNKVGRSTILTNFSLFCYSELRNGTAPARQERHLRLLCKIFALEPARSRRSRSLRALKRSLL